MLVFVALPLQAAPRPAPLVVLDPGHGGGDDGATSKLNNGDLIKEKQLTLLLSRAVKRELHRLGIKAILTRELDSEVPLPNRTAMANRLGASLFVSLHMNARHGSNSPSARGFETFVLNQTTDESSRRISSLENKVLPSSFAGALAHRQSDSQLGLIVKDLSLTANLPQSQHLACLVQDQLSQLPSPYQGHNRGVRQGLFYVLLGADMPSILVEAGFVDHPADRERILSARGRKLTSQHLAQAIAAFLHQDRPATRARILSKCKLLEH